jgi:hypothetical protein
MNSNYLTINKLENLLSQNKIEETLPADLKQLEQKSEILMSKLINNTALAQLTQDAVDSKKEVGNILNDIVNLLKKSCKEASKFYQYTNDIQIIRAQEIMMKLGMEILNMIENLSTEHRNISFLILELIFERGEFDLSSMSIYKFEKNKDKIHMKTNVGEVFITFLIKTLKFSLNKLARKIADENSKNFVEFFLSVAYFRIPQVDINF